jgi:hypothetical protein
MNAAFGGERLRQSPQKFPTKPRQRLKILRRQPPDFAIGRRRAIGSASRIPVADATIILESGDGLAIARE